MIHDPEAGAFVSHLAPAELLRARDRRAALWSTAPPAPPRPLGREDPFLSEAGFHKAVRDRAAAAGGARQAWLENRILERWYTPYLALRSFESGAPNRWSPEMRAAVRETVRRRGALAPGPYRSPALADRLAAGAAEPAVGASSWLVAAGLWSGGRWLERRLRRTAERARRGPLLVR